MLGYAEKQQLDDVGFLILPGFMTAELLAGLRRRVDEQFAAEGDRAGAEFKQEPGCRRLANLVGKGDIFQRVILAQKLLACMRHVLGPDIKLSSLNVRSVNPRWPERQPLHADMGAVADDKGYWVCNSVWILDDITADNGAIRMVPGTHRLGKLPQDVLADPKAGHPQEVLVTGAAGTVVIMNAHLWHGGTENRTDRSRTALHAFFARRDRPQQQYQKQLIRPDVQATLSAEMRDILALDDPLNDRLSAEVAVRSGFLK